VSRGYSITLGHLGSFFFLLFFKKPVMKGRSKRPAKRNRVLPTPAEPARAGSAPTVTVEEGSLAPKPQSQAKAWVFTQNKPYVPGGAVCIVDTASFADVVYMRYQLEKGENGGHDHLQGYIHFAKKVRFGYVQSIPGLKGAHLEVARGSPEDNRAYCSKESTRIVGILPDGSEFSGAEVGDISKCSFKGQRTDLLAIKRRIDAGDSEQVLFHDEETFVPMLRMYKGFREYRRSSFPVRKERTKFVCFIGLTGCGKSYTAAQRYPGAYYLPMAKSGGLVYWDGYNCEDAVIVEEMYGNRFNHNFLKMLGDAGPMQVPVTFGQVNFCSKTIVFTSATHPRYWYASLYKEHPSEWSQLERRIDEITYFRDRYVSEEVVKQSWPVPDWLVLKESDSELEKRVATLDFNRHLF